MLKPPSLRQKMRQQRRMLSPQQQRKASENLCKRLRCHPIFLRSRHIALYLPNDGEIDISPLMELAWQRKKICYLPSLAPFNNKLIFTQFNKNDTLNLNRFGIPEPDPLTAKIRQARALDLVLTPLVAFDLNGGRLGMGGGFYDRSFAFIKKDKRCHSPALIGVAHDFQQVQNLPVNSWDIPMSAIVTDKSSITCSTQA